MTEPNDKIVLTLKGGTAFSDPWVVIHAGTFEEAASMLRQFDNTVGDALGAQDLGLAVGQASVHFQAKTAAARGLNATPVIVAPPAPVAVAAPLEPRPPTDSGWGSAPATVGPTAIQQPPAQTQQYIAPPAAPANGEFHPPQPGPAPIGVSGFPMVWKYGTKDGRQWKAWMSGQPKANLDAGQEKDPVSWVR